MGGRTGPDSVELIDGARAERGQSGRDWRTNAGRALTKPKWSDHMSQAETKVTAPAAEGNEGSKTEREETLQDLLLQVGYVRDRLFSCYNDRSELEPDEAFYLREGLVTAMSGIEQRLVELGALKNDSDIFRCERRD